GGQGGDESLCGYRKYYFFYLWHLLRKADPRFFQESISLASSGASSHWSFGAVSRYLPGFVQKRASVLERLATPAVRSAAAGSRGSVGAGPSVAERQKTDLVRTSLPKLLRHEDRNSMAHSVETRMPFLDYRLVEFAVRCPDSLKLRGGWSKWLLREAMAGTLPEEVRLRKSKLGFNAPESAWLRAGLENGHRTLCRPSQVRLARLLDPARLAAECRRFLDRSAGALPAEALFRAVALELWARVHDVN
ncbi:MAG TPA: asparagine synthase C-terminal domain-containing protein, partial [Candidatus Acidoferrum sp.]|nr:asparagine synthase C-terminal domain-containing protein [Candidatus Acidoferrum sp.]